MSLKNIRDNLDKIQEKGKEYFYLDEDRIRIEREIEELKSKYRADSGREVFSDKNKKLILIKNKMGLIRKDVENITLKIDKEIQKEMSDVIR